jgi:hypothetical protein
MARSPRGEVVDSVDRPGGRSSQRPLGVRWLVTVVAVALLLTGGLALVSATSSASTFAASESVTISARPTVASGFGTVELFGSVDSGKPGEAVTIQAKDCGKDSFRVVAGTTTREGGGWSTRYFPATTTSVRAVSNDVASRPVTIRQRAPIRLGKTQTAGQFLVEIVAKKTFWRKRVSVQRFDRRLGTWSSFKSVVLTESGGSGNYSYTTAEFILRVPKGTLVRATFPLSQARPCYLAGVSPAIRV